MTILYLVFCSKKCKIKAELDEIFQFSMLEEPFSINFINVFLMQSNIQVRTYFHRDYIYKGMGHGVTVAVK